MCGNHRSGRVLILFYTIIRSLSKPKQISVSNHAVVNSNGHKQTAPSHCGICSQLSHWKCAVLSRQTIKTFEIKLENMLPTEQVTCFLPELWSAKTPAFVKISLRFQRRWKGLGKGFHFCPPHLNCDGVTLGYCDFKRMTWDLIRRSQVNQKTDESVRNFQSLQISVGVLFTRRVPHNVKILTAHITHKMRWNAPFWANQYGGGGHLEF